MVQLYICACAKTCTIIDCDHRVPHEKNYTCDATCDDCDTLDCIKYEG